MNLRNSVNNLHLSLTVVTSVVLIAMMLHTVANALSRFFFSAPIYGTNELVEYWYLPILVLLGIPVAQLQREHISATLIVDRMRKPNALAFAMFSCILGVMLSALWAWYGFGEALHSAELGRTAGTSQVIIWPVFFLVPAMFLLLAILYVVESVTMARSQDRHSGIVSYGDATPIQ